LPAPVDDGAGDYLQGSLRPDLSLPTFEVDGMRLNRRVTLIAHDGLIRKHFCPVFPPDRNADDVRDWLKANRVN
jgi:peroxiredoxin